MTLWVHKHSWLNRSYVNYSMHSVSVRWSWYLLTHKLGIFFVALLRVRGYHSALTQTKGNLASCWGRVTFGRSGPNYVSTVHSQTGERFSLPKQVVAIWPIKPCLAVSGRLVYWKTLQKKALKGLLGPRSIKRNWMRLVGASNCQSENCNSPGFDPIASCPTMASKGRQMKQSKM